MATSILSRRNGEAGDAWYVDDERCGVAFRPAAGMTLTLTGRIAEMPRITQSFTDTDEKTGWQSEARFYECAVAIPKAEGGEGAFALVRFEWFCADYSGSVPPRWVASAAPGRWAQLTLTADIDEIARLAAQMNAGDVSLSNCAHTLDVRLYEDRPE